jgi:hypothetical protein
MIKNITEYIIISILTLTTTIITIMLTFLIMYMNDKLEIKEHFKNK